MNKKLKALQKQAKASTPQTFEEAEAEWEQHLMDIDEWEAPDDWYEFDSTEPEYWWNDGQQAHPTRAELIKAPRNKRKERLARTLAFIIGAGTTALVIVAVTPLT